MACTISFLYVSLPKRENVNPMCMANVLIERRRRATERENAVQMKAEGDGKEDVRSTMSIHTHNVYELDAMIDNQHTATWRRRHIERTVLIYNTQCSCFTHLPSPTSIWVFLYRLLLLVFYASVYDAHAHMLQSVGLHFFSSFHLLKCVSMYACQCLLFYVYLCIGTQLNSSTAIHCVSFSLSLLFDFIFVSFRVRVLVSLCMCGCVYTICSTKCLL